MLCSTDIAKTHPDALRLGLWSDVIEVVRFMPPTFDLSLSMTLVGGGRTPGLPRPSSGAGPGWEAMGRVTAVGIETGANIVSFRKWFLLWLP